MPGCSAVTPHNASAFEGVLHRCLGLMGLTILFTAGAICATLESPSIGSVEEETQVLNQENVAGPVEIEFLADCQRGDDHPRVASFVHLCPENK